MKSFVLLEALAVGVCGGAVFAALASERVSNPLIISISIILLLLVQVPLANYRRGVNPLSPTGLRNTKAYRLLARAFAIVLVGYMAISLAASIAYILLAHSIRLYKMSRASEIKVTLIRDNIGRIEWLLGNSYVYLGVVIGMFILFALYMRERYDAQDNVVLTRMYKNNAALAVASRSGAITAEHSQLIRNNIDALRHFSMRTLLHRVAFGLFRPVECLYVMVPGDQGFKIAFARCSSEDYAEYVRQYIQDNHCPALLDTDALLRRASATYQQLSAPGKTVDPKLVYYDCFEKHKVEHMSVTGLTWELQTVQVENWDMNNVDFTYLQRLPRVVRRKLEVRSFVSVPVKHDGEILAVVFLSSSLTPRFLERCAGVYEKYAHLLGSTFALAEEAGILGEVLSLEKPLAETSKLYSNWATVQTLSTSLSELSRFEKARGRYEICDASH